MAGAVSFKAILIVAVYRPSSHSFGELVNSVPYRARYEQALVRSVWLFRALDVTPARSSTLKIWHALGALKVAG